MAFSYTGNPANVNINNAYTLGALPNDGDQAAASTVTSPFIVCVDELHYLAKQFSTVRPHITITVTGDNTKISISPVTVSVFDGTKWFFVTKAATDITKNELEGGGNFTGNANYYIYLRSTGAYVISTDVPDPTLCFKNVGVLNSQQFRYMGSFIASGQTTIFPFNMNDFDYTLTVPLGTAYSLTDFQPAFDTPAAFACFFKPTFARTAKFIVKLQSTATSVDAQGAAWYFDIKPKNASSVVTTWWPGFIVPAPPSNGLLCPPIIVTKECPIDPVTGTFEGINFNKSGANANTMSLIRIWWNGWKE